MSSDRDFSHLYPPFAEKYQLVLGDMQKFLDLHHHGLTCKLVEGFRTAAYQNELYQQGRTKSGKIVTYRDGYHVKSNHQSGMSADIGFFKANGKYIEEDMDDCNAYYGHCLRFRGLQWGGDWHSSKDYPHGEWDPSDHDSYIKAGQYLQSKGLV